MEWLIFGLLFVAGFILARLTSRSSKDKKNKLFAESATQLLHAKDNKHEADKLLLLTTLCRELANYMIRRDPKRFLAVYKKGRAAAEMANGTVSGESKKALLKMLSDKYPFLSNFDIVQVRDYVLYEDALSHFPPEDIEQTYIDIVQFKALGNSLKWWYDITDFENEEDHLGRYVQRIEDTILQQKLHLAIGQYYDSRNNENDSHLEKDAYGKIFDCSWFALHRLSHKMENRYGIYFKDTDNYGIYSSFIYDNGRMSESYYRSDQSFVLEEPLDALLEINQTLFSGPYPEIGNPFSQTPL